MWPDLHHPSVLIFLTALVVAIVSSVRRSLFARSRPLALDVHNTILVAIVLDPSSTRSSIDEIFRAADMPARVRVAAYCHAGEPLFSPVHQQHVRVARHMRRTMTPFSAARARAWLTQHLWRSEQFTLLCPAGAQLCNSWDTLLVDMLQRHPPDSILTTHCHAADVTAGPRDVLPRFLCLGGMRGARIELNSRPVAAALAEGELIPSLFWSPSFSFCESDALQRCPLATGASDGMEATLNSIRLYTHGYSFYAPSRTVAWCGEPADPAPAARKKAGADAVVPPPGTVRTLRQFEEFAGVSFATSTATTRSRTGLTQAAGVPECTVKYGSLENTRAALRME